MRILNRCLWFVGYLLLASPILLPYSFEYYGIDYYDWKQKMPSVADFSSFYTFFGFIPATIYFVYLNEALNAGRKVRRFISIVSIISCLAWLGYLIYLLCTGEFV